MVAPFSRLLFVTNLNHFRARLNLNIAYNVVKMHKVYCSSNANLRVIRESKLLLEGPDQSKMTCDLRVFKGRLVTLGNDNSIGCMKAPSFQFRIIVETQRVLLSG